MAQSLLHVSGILGTSLAAVDTGLGAPFLGEPPDGAVGCFVKAEEVADDTAVQQSTVRVGIGEVGGHEVAFAKVVEDILRGGKLFVGERAEV